MSTLQTDEPIGAVVHRLSEQLPEQVHVRARTTGKQAAVVAGALAVVAVVVIVVKRRRS